MGPLSIVFAQTTDSRQLVINNFHFRLEISYVTNSQGLAEVGAGPEKVNMQHYYLADMGVVPGRLRWG